MFKPSPQMAARLRLTTKQVGPGYYKGNRTGSMGFFAKPGSYVIDWKKVRTYVAPENLDNFPLTPFVTKVMPPTKSKYIKGRMQDGQMRILERGLQGKDYLNYWRSENAEEVIEYERREFEEEQRRAKEMKQQAGKKRQKKQEEKAKLAKKEQERKEQEMIEQRVREQDEIRRKSRDTEGDKR